MKFFLDENFPRSAKSLLVSDGHEVLDALDFFDPGAEDGLLFAKAQELGAVFLTTDRDFFHTAPSWVDSHAGIIVIALRQPTRARIISRLAGFLKSEDESSISGNAYQLRDNTYSVRRN